MDLEPSPDGHQVLYQTSLYTQLQLLPASSPLMSRDTKYAAPPSPVKHSATALPLCPNNNFSVMSGQFSVFLGWTSTKQRIKCLVQGLNTMHPSSLEPVTFDQVTYTLLESLCSFTACLLWSMSIEQHLYQKCMGDLHKTCTLKSKLGAWEIWNQIP